MPVFPENLSQMEYFDYLRKEGLLTDDQFNELIELDEKINAGNIGIDYIWQNRLNSLKELFLKKRNFEISDNEFKRLKEDIMNKDELTLTEEFKRKYLKEEENIIGIDGYKKLKNEKIKDVNIGDQLHIFWNRYDLGEEKDAYVKVIQKDSNIILFDNNIQIRFNNYKNSGGTIYRIKDINDTKWDHNGYSLLKVEILVKK